MSDDEQMRESYNEQVEATMAKQREITRLRAALAEAERERDDGWHRRGAAWWRAGGGALSARV